jgi:riboflavin-specific deaminase-like protein
VEVRRLLPDPAVVDADEQFRALRLSELAPADRPYVVANMVSTADGRATLAGRSGPIGNETDRRIFHLLRTQADAVLVGSGTLRAERYGRLVRDPELRALRTEEGLTADPLGVTVTRSGRVPFDIPLFQDPESKVMVFAAPDAEFPPAAAAVDVVALPEEQLTMAEVLRRLRREHGVASVLCEGGPTVLATLLAEDCLDELFLCLAPRLAGGGSELGTVEGTGLSKPAELELRWALESEGHLFLRYLTTR